MKRTLCDLLSSLILSASLLSVGCAVPEKIDFEDYQESKVRKKTLEAECAILVSAPNHWWEYFRIPFEFIYEKSVASALAEEAGVKTYTITFDAKWQDLKLVLRDPKVKHIIITGHGSWSTWQASDCTVYEDMIAAFMARNNLAKKSGFFIRHTCGNNRYAPIEVLDKHEYATLITSLEDYGAKNIFVDVHWTDQDMMFGKKRNRISYTLSSEYMDSKYTQEQIEKIIDFWNEKIAAKWRENECIILGASVSEDPYKIRCYEGIVGPFEYIFDPIPDYKKVKTGTVKKDVQTNK